MADPVREAPHNPDNTYQEIRTSLANDSQHIGEVWRFLEADHEIKDAADEMGVQPCNLQILAVLLDGTPPSSLSPGRQAGATLSDFVQRLQLDHNAPRSSGGSNNISNRRLVCGSHNRRKSNALTLIGLRRKDRKEGFMAEDSKRFVPDAVSFDTATSTATADPVTRSTNATGGEAMTPMTHRTERTAVLKWTLTTILLLAAPALAQNPADVERGLQLKQRAEDLKMLSFGFARLSQAFDEDIQSRNAPFNAAAAAKYCAEYTLRALATPRMRREFKTVAGNLAYDVVAESADAAELFAEMTALATDVQTAEGLANGARFYFVAADLFKDELLPGDDAKQGGQRLLRAMHAAERADRWVERMKNGRR